MGWRIQAALVPIGIALGVGTVAASPCKSNLLIVLDRSCSMSKPPDDNDSARKWDLAVAAIAKLTGDFKGKVRFGLTLFPDEEGDRCTQEKIPIPVGDDNEQPINDLLSKTDIEGPCVTNIDTAMQQAATDPALDDTDRRSFVLLISDGAQSKTCGGVEQDPVTVKVLEELYHKRWVATYVVGFGGAVRKASLDAFAEAGGVPLAGETAYYQADDAKALDDALAAIGDVVGSIEFGCPGQPCPDGRCREPGQICSANGFCVTPTPDGGSTLLDAGTLDGRIAAGDGGGGVDVTSGGCSCRAARGRSTAPWWSLLLAVWLLRRRGWQISTSSP